MVDIYLILHEVYYPQKWIENMDSCATEDTEEICWFCRKGRYEDCMKMIPIQGKSEGPHDCTFDTKLVPCKSQH